MSNVTSTKALCLKIMFFFNKREKMVWPARNKKKKKKNRITKKTSSGASSQATYNHVHLHFFSSCPHMSIFFVMSIFSTSFWLILNPDHKTYNMALEKTTQNLFKFSLKNRSSRKKNPHKFSVFQCCELMHGYNMV